MTREQAKQNLIGFGIENPTDEAITNYLNQIGGETKKERERADKYKADADKVKDLQKQLEDAQNADKSELEKAQDRIAELEKTNAKNAQLKQLADLGIKGEQAEKLIGEDGVLDYAVLGQIITDREQASALAKEQEIAGNRAIQTEVLLVEKTQRKPKLRRLQRISVRASELLTRPVQMF